MARVDLPKLIAALILLSVLFLVDIAHDITNLEAHPAHFD